MTVTEEKMSAMTFGCELEYEGISQATAAKAVAEVTGGTARYEGCHLSNWVVTMPDGRKWQVVSDGSLSGTSAETVTPILKVADIETLQEVLRACLVVGARVLRACRLRALRLEGDLQGEENVGAKLARVEGRLEEPHLGGSLRAVAPKVVEVEGAVAVRVVVVGVRGVGSEPSRVDLLHRRVCHAANLLDEGVVGLLRVPLNPRRLRSRRLEDQLLLLVENPHEVLDLRGREVLDAHVDVKPRAVAHPRALALEGADYDLRVFLLRLGMIGGYYKNPRMHLMKRMPGSAAWKDGRHD